jgi:hypothetical protein
MEKKFNFVKLMYVMAAVMFVVCLYMIFYNVSYLSNYAATYGMSLGAMWSDVLQYVIAGSANYFAFGFIFLAIAKLYQKIETSCGPICTCGGEEAEAEEVETVAECACGCGCTCEDEAEEVKMIGGVKVRQRKKVRY